MTLYDWISVGLQLIAVFGLLLAIVGLSRSS